MADMETIKKIKAALRISHDALDEDIGADIDACLSDLKVCGVINADPEDPLILNAIKLFCSSMFAEEPQRSGELLHRYDALKSCLQMAQGYGWEETTGE